MFIGSLRKSAQDARNGRSTVAHVASHLSGMPEVQSVPPVQHAVLICDRHATELGISRVVLSSGRGI